MKATNGEKNILNDKMVIQSSKKNPPLFVWCIIIKFAIKLIESEANKKFSCGDSKSTLRIWKILRVSSVWNNSGAITTNDPFNR